MEPTNGALDALAGVDDSATGEALTARLQQPRRWKPQRRLLARRLGQVPEGMSGPQAAITEIPLGFV